MAADFIKIIRTDANAVFASELVSLPNTLRAVVELLTKIQQKGFRMFANTDFSVFEANYGIPAGKGQAIFDLVNGTLLALQGTAQNANAVELINRVG